MPEPSEFLALQSLQAAIGAITVAGGYHYTVAAAAVKLDPNHNVEALVAPGGPRPFVVLEVPPTERWVLEPAQQLFLVLPVTVHWVHDGDATSDLSRLRTFFRGCADIERAISADVERGGVASDTRIVKRTPDYSVDGAQVWARIDVEIWMHRTVGQA